MKRTKIHMPLTFAAVLQCSLVMIVETASAQSPEELLEPPQADAEDTAPSPDAPHVVERTFRVKAPAASYSKDGATVEILCRLRLDWPHKSDHQPGTINVESQVTCDSAVVNITSLLQLYYNGSVANSNINENAGQSSLYNQVAAPCQNGGWQAHGEALVTFPPGVTPPSDFTSLDSQPISIACDP